VYLLRNVQNKIQNGSFMLGKVVIVHILGLQSFVQRRRLSNTLRLAISESTTTVKLNELSIAIGSQQAMRQNYGVLMPSLLTSQYFVHTSKTSNPQSYTVDWSNGR